LNESSAAYALVTREAKPEAELQISGHFKLILEEFFDVLPKDLPGKLPHVRDIQHAINLNYLAKNSSKRV